MDGFSGEEGAGGKGGWQEKRKKVRGVTDTEHIMNNMCGRERESLRERAREEGQVLPSPPVRLG